MKELLFGKIATYINIAKSNYTANEFAIKCNIDPYLMGKLVRGEQCNITIEILQIICGQAYVKINFNDLLNIYKKIVADTMQVSRGEIYWVNFGQGVGSEQSGLRPAVIIQNNKGNKHAPTILVAPLTSQINRNKLPTHVFVDKTCGIDRSSIVMLEQMRTIDKNRLQSYIGICTKEVIKSIDKAYKIQGGIETNTNTNINLYDLIYSILELNSIKMKNSKTRIFLINQFKEYCSQNKLDYNEVYREYKEKIKYTLAV